jgi:regulator of protease activity HflC (stomatin/prohibitin superfamily)
MITIDRREERVSWVCAVLLLLNAGGIYMLAAKHLQALQVEYLLQTAALAGIGGLVAILAGAQAALERAAREELRDEAALAGRERQIFDTELDATGRRQQAAAQFRKAILPITVVIISVAEAALSVMVARRLLTVDRAPTSEVGGMLPVAAILLVVGVLSFVVGKYVAGMAFGEKRVYLRAVSGVVLLVAVLSAASALASLLLYWEQPGIARAAGWLFIVVGLALAVELVTLLVVDLYRPHGADVEDLAVYESRILGIFTQPRGVLLNLADIIEYQFGFQLTEQTLARSFRGIVLPVVAVQLVTLGLLTSLVYVQPHEYAVAQQWGRPGLQELGPGLHVRLPWPATRVERIPAGRVATLRVAPPGLEALETSDDKDIGLILWQHSVFSKGLFLAAGPQSQVDQTGVAVNLAVAVADIRYSINDARAFYTSHQRPRELLRLLSRRQLSRFLLSIDLSELLSKGPVAMQTSLRDQLQTTVDARKLGVTIVSVGIPALQPPPAVAPAFEAVLKAGADAEVDVLMAKQYVAVETAKASEEAGRYISEANAETVRTIKLAEAEVLVFQKLRAVHAKSPELYETRVAMDALELWLKDVRKVIITSKSDSDVISIELKKVRPDLLDAFGGD